MKVYFYLTDNKICNQWGENVRILFKKLYCTHKDTQLAYTNVA